MAGRDDWDLDSPTSDFNLEDDFGILGSEDFELLDSFDGDLIQTDLDEELAIESLDDLRLTEAELSAVAGEKASEAPEPVSPRPSDEPGGTEIIEPSTLVDEKLSELRTEEPAEDASVVEKVSDPDRGHLEPASATAPPPYVEPEPTDAERVEAASPVDETEAVLAGGEGEEAVEPAAVVALPGGEEAAHAETDAEEQGVAAVEAVAKSNEAPEAAAGAAEGAGGKDMAQTVVGKEEQVKQVLERLLDASPDFEGAAVVSADGFVLASSLPEGTDELKVGAMAAAILSLGERAAGEMGKGSLETVFVQGADGYVLVTTVSDSVLLAVATSRYAKLGLVFYELRSVREQLRELFA